jgi:2-oxoglutarate dehydrogenase E2 component (dihydrolipoamide succinyltransferase)
MSKVELIMPKMGESIMEATILKWAKQVGDPVEVDETILEIATDKVDSEVPSPIKGTIAEILFKENDVVAVGRPIAIIAVEAGALGEPVPTPSIEKPVTNGAPAPALHETQKTVETTSPAIEQSASGRFYSPLVRNIARQENIPLAELEAIPGSGQNGRLTKADLLAYLGQRKAAPAAAVTTAPPTLPASSKSMNGQSEIVEMDRMRRLIADHMVHSKKTSAHVTSFIEIDVTDMVQWREREKANFEKQYGEKITYTPIFLEAVAKAIRDFPMVNVSVEGTNIIVKKNVNIGMATALPTGNLIVPVIRNADELNLVGLTRQVNDLAARARKNQLKPEEIQGGTFTLTNVGTFGNLMGTPIINQPQVAILSVGAIKKKPAVIETQYGDVIAIRQMMFLSLSYDHRVVDGYLGGSFLRRVGDYMEAFKGM